MREFYRRRLPHQVPAGFPIFLTWNLDGAVPKHVREEWLTGRQRLEQQSGRPGETAAQRRVRLGKVLFYRADQFLDQAREGPMYLRDAAAAQIVVDALFYGAADRYDLYAFVVMSNHVHVLLTPRRELAEITKAIKGVTANRINERLGQHGHTVWQHESYDHWARDEAEMLRILEYIENNPVAAGLCLRPEEWQWSSASRRRNWLPGHPWRPDHGNVPPTFLSAAD
jgi:REP element-mobilizing transposase RayT